jgi:hypothetical protein
MSLICFVASLDEFSVVVLLLRRFECKRWLPNVTRQVLFEFDICGLPNVKQKKATPSYSVKKPSGKKFERDPKQWPDKWE